MERYRPKNDIFKKPVRLEPSPVEALRVGLRVCDIGDPGVIGKIVTVGPEVSGVRWPGSKDTRYVGNRYLKILT